MLAQLVFSFAYPATRAARKKITSIYRTAVPDLDNCIKLVFDALNGIVYKDDSQIAVVCAQKIFGPTNSTYIEVTKLKN